MSEFSNCVNTKINPDQTTTECCTPCQQVAMQDNNCNCGEGCDPISVKCASIDSAVCIPIIADQIFDSVSGQKDDLGSVSGLVFNLDSTNPNYVAGQPICIQKVGIAYDFIGLAQGVAMNTQVLIGGKTYTLTPTSLYDASTVAGTPVDMFDEMNGTISLQSPCYCNGTAPVSQGTKYRIIERNRAFQVANLKILVSGLIGCNTFTATANTAALFTPNTNLIPLSVFGISNMVFTTQICCPNNVDRFTLDDYYGPSLTLGYVSPTSDYTAPIVAGNPGTFTANVEVSFTANRKLDVTKRGAIAVFTTPNAIILKNNQVIS